MITNHRPSILRRPLRSPTKNNVENRDLEFQQQQDYWQARAQKAKETEDRFNRSIYPDSESKKRDQEEMKEMMERQLQEAREKRASEAAAQRGSWVPEQITADHPWAHKKEDPMHMQIAEIRRRIAREAAEENRSLVIQRREQERLAQQKEKEQVRKAESSEESWWNHGAASDRWLPPERRTKSGKVAAAYREQHEAGAPYRWDEQGAPARAAHPAPKISRAPYAWEAAEEQTAGPSQQQPQRPPMPPKVYPWSWDS